MTHYLVRESGAGHRDASPGGALVPLVSGCFVVSGLDWSACMVGSPLVVRGHGVRGCLSSSPSLPDPTAVRPGRNWRRSNLRGTGEVVPLSRWRPPCRRPRPEGDHEERIHELNEECRRSPAQSPAQTREMKDRADVRLQVAQDQHARDLARAEQVELEGWQRLMEIPGMTPATAAAVLDVNESTVSRWLGRFPKSAPISQRARSSQTGKP